MLWAAVCVMVLKLATCSTSNSPTQKLTQFALSRRRRPVRTSFA